MGTSIMSRCLLFKETETAQDRGYELNYKKLLETQYSRKPVGENSPFPETS